MTYDPTNHDDLSELLSGYLDGELTADEQALVEQRLGESAEFRQLHDDLRALRTSLDWLPRYKLSEDLAPAVLRRAERAMLSAPAAVPAELPAGKVTLAQRTASLDRKSRTWQAVGWSAVAVAVALLIMVFNPRGNRDVADVALKQDTLKRAESKQIEALDAEQNLRFETDRGAAVAGKMAADSSVDEPTSLAAPAEVKSFAKDRASGALGAGRRAAALADDSQAADSKLNEEMSGSGQADGAGGGLGGAVPALSAKKEQLPSKRLENQPAAPAAPLVADEFREHSRDGRAPAGEMSFEVAATGVVVVRCEISAEAFRSRAFEPVLAEQQIALVENGLEAAAVDGLQVSDFADVAAGPAPAAEPVDAAAGGGSGEATEETVIGEKADALGLADKNAGAKQSAAESPFDAYVVEASPVQIEATLAALGARNAEFSSIAIADSRESSNAPSARADQNGATERLAKAKDAAVQDELSKESGESLADEAKGESDAAENQAGDVATFNLQLKPGRAARPESFSAPERASVRLRRGLAAARPQGSAQRVLVVPENNDLAASEESVERRYAEGGQGPEKETVAGEKPQSERRKSAIAAGAPAPAQGLSHAQIPASAAAAPAADGLDSAAVLKFRQNAASDGEPSAVRVLFLFRVVPSADADR